MGRNKSQHARIVRFIEALMSDRKHVASSWANCLTWASEYAEPGYDSPELGVWFGDWNDIQKRKVTISRSGDPSSYPQIEWQTVSNYPSRLAKLLERVDCSVEWHDEWSTCSDCGKAVRTNPDCMSWRPSYHLGDGELLCDECYGGHDSPYFDRFDICEAWYHFLSQYHGGQSSLAYRRLSQLTRLYNPGHNSSLTNMTDNAKAIYRRLVERYESDRSSVKI